MLASKKIPKVGSIIIGAFVLLCDQLSKLWVLKSIGSHDTLPICPSLNLILTFNPGVTFGLLHAHSTMHYVMLILGACILLCIVCLWWWKAENILQRYATGIIIFGAIGNLVDRIRFRAVVDFIDFYIADWHWYTFNLADSAIVLGVSLLFLDAFSTPNRRTRLSKF